MIDFDAAWNGERLLREYDALNSSNGTRDLFDEWEILRREVASWKAVTELRARQDITDAIAKRNAKEVARYAPLFEERDADIKRAFLIDSRRSAMEETLGRYVFERWQLDVDVSNPAIRSELETEQRLGDRYSELLGGARIQLNGNTYTLAGLAQFRDDPDRNFRRQTVEAQWAYFESIAGELDTLFDDLVRCRTAIARKLGYRTYTPVAYRRLGRTDYGAAEVRGLRDEILSEIVPLVAHLTERQARALGIERIMPWDAFVYDRLPKAKTAANDRVLIDELQSALEALHPEVGAFATTLRARGFLDIADRPNKASGAFCTFLPNTRMPFVFANVTGASRNLITLAHELGHAFQNYRSRDQRPLEYIVPTNEIGEVHSMAMEFLLWPFLDSMLGEDAHRFRVMHLHTLISMLPYIAAIDEFQERVYEEPDCTPEERHTVWREMEAKYLPWRDPGGIPTLMRGAAWQAQRHVYRFPFYYIDYGIAMCCALQLWTESRSNHHGALDKYVTLCDLGGSQPFRSAVESANLLLPFERGTLSTIARESAQFLIDPGRAR